MSVYQGPVTQEIKDRAKLLIRVVYAHNGVGGNLHIILDDDNFGDDSIKFCRQAVAENYHKQPKEACGAESELLDIFEPLTKNQRKLLSEWCGYAGGNQ